jgi:type IV fimbrial biogenesis protein FimT
MRTQGAFGIHSSAGFTIAELMVTIAVGVILISAAVPAYDGFITGQRVKTAAQELFVSLLYARSEALKRNGNVSITPAVGGWVDGWIVSTNSARTYADCTDGTPEADCLKVQPAGAGIDIDDGPAAVTYRRDGRTAESGISFRLCDAEGGADGAARTVSVDLTGRPNIAHAAGCA